MIHYSLSTRKIIPPIDLQYVLKLFLPFSSASSGWYSERPQGRLGQRHSILRVFLDVFFGFLVGTLSVAEFTFNSCLQASI